MKVTTWLPNHRRWVVHFTATSASWLNAVEGFFSILSRRRLKRGVFTSVSQLQGRHYSLNPRAQQKLQTLLLDKEEQARCLHDIDRQEAAEQSYIDEGVHILELARNAPALFERQSDRESGELFMFVLSNSTWEDGEIVTFR